MEMTIDKAILTIKNAKRFTYDDIYEEAFDVAIETMRKYQQIEQIVKDDYEKDCGNKADFFRIGDIRMTINGESR